MISGIVAGGLSLIDDLYYSGEERAADLNAAEAIKVQREQIALGNAQLATQERLAMLQQKGRLQSLAVVGAIALGIGAFAAFR